jgi:GNAT superfamily N-acetyltransferase
MSSTTVRPVRSARERRIFLNFPWQIYRDDPLWVPPLLPQLAERIDPQRGAMVKRGAAELYIAWRDGRPVGTVCAAEDKPTNASRGAKECVFGFFEYVPDFEVAASLLEQVIAWARDRGLEALFGPFNLDYEDGYGVLIEGWDRPPALMCGHTPRYYRDFMEQYGFEPARGDNLAYEIDCRETAIVERLGRLAERFRRRGEITIRGADLTQWERELDRVHHLLGVALAHLPDHIGWQRESLEALLAPFRDLADPELVLFAEVGGETVGWLPAVPNMNEWFIHANGLRYPWDYARLWLRMRRKTESLTIKSVLVSPEYWGTGVPVLLFDEMAKRVLKHGYRWIDMSLTSADNPNTPILAERLGARIYKRYRVYRRPI